MEDSMRPGQHFVGRNRELEALAGAYDAPGGQLVLLYGRRRIGKTYLLQRFSEERRTVFYQATRQAAQVELAAFSREVEGALGPFPVPGAFAFRTWEEALDYLTSHASRERLAVILDEFPYLCDSTPGLPSLIQRWWDRQGRTSRILLILCGSAQTFMTELDSGSAPLHQRFTKKIALGPLSYREAAEFVPSLSPANRARVYGVLGGTPLYLKEWRAEQSLRDNLIVLFGDPASMLVDSARLVLHTDLGDSTASYRALSAIAGGDTRRNEILQKAKITNERVLVRLEELKLITKRVPVTEGASSRRGFFVVTDPYFRFWFRYVEPHRASIDRGFGEQLIDEVIVPELDNHMGGVFEDMARDFAVQLVAQRELQGIDIGSWWSSDGDHEIDIVGIGRKKPTFIGTVKWRNAALGREVYKNLADHARALGVDESIPWLMVGRGGVEATLIHAEPHVRGYSIGNLYE
ncbi:MAG: ATP-binding protein [Candidatus Eremiobacteraeota bacterium]|nr:ATP-binding protein [Candidatus Eremiobacteraeota bacterium]